MKKVVMLLAALVLVSAIAGMLYADTQEAIHIRVSGLVKFSGGSKNIGLTPQAFDSREELRQLHSKYINHDIIFDTMYPVFDDKAWADIKYRTSRPVEERSMLEKFSAETPVVHMFPEGKMPGKPIAAKSVPSAKNGLLNPRNPVKMMTFGNVLTLDFEPQIPGTYQARLLDSKGKELARIKSPESPYDESEKITLSVPDGARNYYLELADLYPATKRYCYILLNVEADPVKPAEDPRVTAYLARIEADNQAGERMFRDYMDRKGITDMEQLTEDDMFTMAKERLSPEDPAQQQALSSIEIMQNYMKQHNISSSQELTEKDEKAINSLVIMNSVKSWPASYRSAVDRYMKQHNIKGYENLTPDDLEAVSRQFNK